MSRKLSLCSIVVGAFLISTVLFANQMVTDTKKAINTIRSNVIKKAHEDQKTIRWGSAFIDLGRLFHSKVEIENAKVAFPFFKVKGADACLHNIGSTQEDIDYLKSVFTEFYASGEQSKYRLYTILHRHMMLALGFPVTKTLDQFKHMMENTNHKGYPKALNKKQFDIYCRCVARGLYADYWVEHRYH